MTALLLSLALQISMPLPGENPFISLLTGAIQKEYGSHVQFTLQELIVIPKTQRIIENTVGQRFASPSLIFGRISYRQEIKGYYFVDTLQAKRNTFDILVLFDRHKNVRHIQIIRNPDNHNQTIDDTSWLSQFRGMNTGAFPSWKDNIDGISGATLSVNNIVKGLWRLSLLLSIIDKP